MLRKTAKPLSVLLPGQDDSRLIAALALDSRQVIPGCLFFAFPGGLVDGRDFIDEAIKKGASVIVFEDDGACVPPASEITLCIPAQNVRHLVGQVAARFFEAPSRDLQLVGITGTNGKTSISHFLAQAWAAEGLSAGVLGTMGNGPLSALSQSTHTTLNPIALQQQLVEFVDQGMTHVAMEVSSHALDQGRVEGIHFTTATLTNLSRDHLDYHKDMAAYAQAKEQLFQQYGLTNAVINADDAFGRVLIERYQDRLDVVSYSIGTDNRLGAHYVNAVNIEPIEQGYLVQVNSSWGTGHFICGLLGHFNISNVLATLSVLLLNGVLFEQALMICSTLSTVSGRMESFGGDGAPRAVVDYAHTPDALEKALLELKRRCRGRLWCVFGCGGDRDKGKRGQMAAMAEKYADQIIVTNDNPRHESAESIADDIFSGFKQANCGERILDREVAIQTAVQTAAINDIVLIAGKGHESTQIIGDQVFPFSDAQVICAALAKR